MSTRSSRSHAALPTATTMADVTGDRFAAFLVAAISGTDRLSPGNAILRAAATTGIDIAPIAPRLTHEFIDAWRAGRGTTREQIAIAARHLPAGPWHDPLIHLAAQSCRGKEHGVASAALGYLAQHAGAEVLVGTIRDLSDGLLEGRGWDQFHLHTFRQVLVTRPERVAVAAALCDRHRIMEAGIAANLGLHACTCCGELLQSAMHLGGTDPLVIDRLPVGSEDALVPIRPILSLSDARLSWFQACPDRQRVVAHLDILVGLATDQATEPAYRDRCLATLAGLAPERSCG